MTKQIIDRSLPGGRVNETDLALMEFLVGCEAGRAAVSREQLSGELGCSPATLRSCVKRLERKLLLEVHERRHRNGGTLENEYVLTEAGRDAFELASRVQGPRE